MNNDTIEEAIAEKKAEIELCWVKTMTLNNEVKALKRQQKLQEKHEEAFRDPLACVGVTAEDIPNGSLVKRDEDSFFFSSPPKLESEPDMEVYESTEIKEKRIIREISELINRNNLEAGSDTPDFILSEYLYNCLMNFNKTTVARTKWYQ